VEISLWCQTNKQNQEKPQKAEIKTQEARKEGKEIFGLWKQAVDGLKLDINSIYTNVVQTIKSGHSHRITESQNSRGWKGPLWVI